MRVMGRAGHGAALVCALLLCGSGGDRVQWPRCLFEGLQGRCVLHGQALACASVHSNLIHQEKSCMLVRPAWAVLSGEVAALRCPWHVRDARAGCLIRPVFTAAGQPMTRGSAAAGAGQTGSQAGARAARPIMPYQARPVGANCKSILHRLPPSLTWL